MGQAPSNTRKKPHKRVEWDWSSGRPVPLVVPAGGARKPKLVFRPWTNDDMYQNNSNLNNDEKKRRVSRRVSRRR